MSAKTDFWLALHNACLCYEDEGDTLNQRVGSVVASWESMPNSARNAILQEMRFLLTELLELDAELMIRERTFKSEQGVGQLVASNGNPATDGEPALDGRRGS